ncbi:MAG: response regulator transcription factor [Oligoflexales bacterium]
MLRDLKVLIVEDSPLVQKQITLAFEDAGFDVIGKAQNGVEALMKCKKVQPDLISIDVIMPEMHGIDLYKQIKKLYPDIKCLFITCLRSDQIKDAFPNEIQPFQFLDKPTNPETLYAAVETLYETPTQETEPTNDEKSPELPTQGAS